MRSQPPDPRRRLALIAACWLLAAPGAAEDPADAALSQLDLWIDSHLGELLATYRELHANPELSFAEHATAQRVADSLRAAGFEVSTGLAGTGVIGVLRNGPGPRLLIRGDMDALPVTEATGLDYASRVRTTGPDGREVGVMHACGHDLHTANLIGTARALAALRSHWSGTLLALAQPAEEIGQGAHRLLSEGLFERFPRPDFAVALHVESELAAGSVGVTPGWAFANVDAVDVTIHGRGGHGARPHSASDPIVTAAHFITALQTLVSRRVDPQEAAVVTVGSVHAGHKHNVIPDEAHLQLTVRSYTDEVREELLAGIRRTARASCAIWECPKPPDVAVRELYTPAVFNDPALAARARSLFQARFGSANVSEPPPTMGGEDFGRYGRALGVPSLLFRIGAAHPEQLAAAETGGPSVPALHSSRFAPPPEPTLRTGLRALGSLALELLGPRIPANDPDVATGSREPNPSPTAAARPGTSAPAGRAP